MCVLLVICAPKTDLLGPGSHCVNSTRSSTMMATSLAVLLSLLLHLTFTASAPDHPAPGQTHPQLTGCVSTNMETFRCSWNVGPSQDFSEPGALRLFYINKKGPHASPNEWSECPQYRHNECFFNENHTLIWTYYSVQLRSRDQHAVYDEKIFVVEDIVQPDPPFGLNWTLLNVSVTGATYDIMLSWKPPLSADVETGWMRLDYEVQYRDVSSDLWQVTGVVKSTERSLFGFQTNTNHEVRVRCKMIGGKAFGRFSDSVFVHIPSKVSGFPVMALLIFAALFLVAILMLVIILQQEKLMVILLPPVPGPKIRGIDPDLLKKGKLRELTSILGAPPDLRPELYNNDPWVEFIDLDMEEQSDRLTDLDTDFLVQRSLSSNCTPLTMGFRDDDSGRASCCDPDLPGDLEPSPFLPLVPPPSAEALAKEPTSACPENSSEPSTPVQSPVSAAAVVVGGGGEPVSVANAAGKAALYTQVSEVRSSGNVLLSPEEHAELEQRTCEEAAEERVKAEKQKEKQRFQLVQFADPSHGGYMSELSAGKMSPRLSSGDMIECGPAGGDSGNYHMSDSTPWPTSLPPVSVYTVVDGVDRQNSLFLTPNSAPVPQLMIPKTVPMPDVYLTPELLGNVTP